MKSMSGFVREMEKRGYSTRAGARLKGKSGAHYQVDMLMEKKGEKMILMKSRGRDPRLEIIQAFLTGVDVGAKPFCVTGRKADRICRKLLSDYKMSRLRPE
jgi:hypothetical protein